MLSYILLSVVLLIVILLSVFVECHSADCYFVRCYPWQFCSAECRGALHSKVLSFGYQPPIFSLKSQIKIKKRSSISMKPHFAATQLFIFR